MSDADWIEKAASQMTPQPFATKAAEIIRQAYAAHCQALDVNGLAERIARATYRFVQDGPYDRVPGEDFRECERMVSNILAPLLAENERRLKLLVECRNPIRREITEHQQAIPFHSNLATINRLRDEVTEDLDLLARIDELTAKGTGQ